MYGFFVSKKRQIIANFYSTMIIKSFYCRKIATHSTMLIKALFINHLRFEKGGVDLMAVKNFIEFSTVSIGNTRGLCDITLCGFEQID